MRPDTSIGSKLYYIHIRGMGAGISCTRFRDSTTKNHVQT